MTIRYFSIMIKRYLPVLIINTLVVLVTNLFFSSLVKGLYGESNKLLWIGLFILMLASFFIVLGNLLYGISNYKFFFINSKR